MIRDRQHGPVVELNRIALRRSRSQSTGKLYTNLENGWNATVFAQMTQKISLLTYDVLMVRIKKNSTSNIDKIKSRINKMTR